MDEMKLTKEAGILLRALYKEYLARRKQEVERADACLFIDLESIRAKYTPKWTAEDLADTCRELGRAGVLQCFYGDDDVSNVILTTDGIIYMENRFKNGLAAIFSCLETLRSFLPW